ncbi:secretogranin-2a [Sinocyclocheilus grahami]|uniref:Secretogranin-2-like n=1 Tax=Sinocyclocheilus grahami TaxID=75366 RepID=A0A672NFY2_SINGR|nr:PREDICTED: secretogranin-2-like [Sinocyclocheilus grahami]
MSSSSRCCATGVFILPSLLLLPLFLSLVCGVQGATLREHRLSESEPVSYGPASQIRPPPSAEMLRALRYIQSLSQRTPPDHLDDQQDTSDGMERVRSLLQLAAPARLDRGMEVREEEKDNTQELLQAVLTTLQQTEEHMVPQKTSQKVIAPSQPRYTVQPFPRPKQQLEVETSAENYGRTSWANPDSQRRHRKFPLVFENEEDQEQPLKRTNEKAEEQYTPQNLATLQSVFEELSAISTSKANSKREDGEDADDADDNDLYRQRKMVLEDIMGSDEWAPLEEQTETEEEERERHGFNRNLEDEQEEEEDEEDDYVKRSNQPDWFQTGKEEEPEDIAKLVDYYLLQILEKKEQEQQKRREASKSEQESDREVQKKDVDEDDGEEDDMEEREIRPIHSTFPESLSKIITISQKLRIPPEEVLELLHNEKQKDLLGTPKKSMKTTHKTFAAAPHRRPLETSEGNSITQGIMNILKLVNAAQQNNNRPTQPKTSRYYERKTSRDDYDDTAGEEDELVNYLALEMFGHGQRRARLTPLRDKDQPVYERGDYFDKSVPEKRPANHENAVTGLDNNTILQILRYLDPESDDADETDSEGKTVPEM